MMIADEEKIRRVKFARRLPAECLLVSLLVGRPT